MCAVPPLDTRFALLGVTEMRFALLGVPSIRCLRQLLGVT